VFFFSLFWLPSQRHDHQKLDQQEQRLVFMTTLMTTNCYHDRRRRMNSQPSKN
jgi:hypothetical protein